jgi:hypothetical protein
MLAVVAITVRSSLDTSSTAPQPVRVRSTGRVFTTLDHLVDASEVVVIGRAVSVAPGRLFTDSGSGSSSEGVVSQITMIEVGAVLAGPDPGQVIALEEEATTSDGRSLVVDGLRPTRVGDQGIFFLVHGDPDISYFATVATSGRLLRASLGSGDDHLLAVDAGAGHLAGRLAAMGGRAVTEAVQERASETGRAGS